MNDFTLPSIHPPAMSKLGELLAADVYGFKAAGVGFILPKTHSAQVLCSPIYSRLPGTPEHFMGLCNLDGTLVPLYSLKPIVASQRQSTVEVALLIPLNDGCAMLAIDQMPELLKLEIQEDRCGNDLPLPLKQSVRRRYLCEEQIWLELDWEVFFMSLSVLSTEDSAAP